MDYFLKLFGLTNSQTNSVPVYFYSLVYLLITIVLSLIVSSFTLLIAKKIGKKTTSPLIQTLSNSMNWALPVHLSVLVLGLLLAFPFVRLPEQLLGFLRHLLSICIIGTMSFVLIRLVGLVRIVLLQNYDVTESDNLKARTVHTQLKVIERILVFIILVIAIASMLMTFDKIRQIGISLLASAGVVGIILGIAAQRSIATIFAGIQIALTQPIRIDDVVIVEGEWGRIEEITLTYVVVRIWDLRRLIVPITYFIEKSFQNWTRISADVLGTVFIWVDYSVPLEEIREEFKRLLQGSPLWDQKVCVTQVTNTTERAVEIRLLMSTQDASKGWDLRCFIRENIISYLQKNYPQALPRVRLDMENGGREEAVQAKGK